MSSINLLAAVQSLNTKNMQSLMLKTTKYQTNTGGNLVPIATMVNAVVGNPIIQQGVNLLKAKLNGKVFEKHHFGRVGMAQLGLIDIPIDIQRELEKKHIGNKILPFFDPRIALVINVTYDVNTKRYKAWDGLQTLSTILILISNGLLKTENWETYEVKVNIFDSDLEVPGPGSTTTNMGTANYAFRTVSGAGKKEIHPFYMMRSEYNGANLYGSDLIEDLHSRDMWEAMLKYKMHPADVHTKDTPSHISHISGMKKIAGHGTSKFKIEAFDASMEFLSAHFGVKDDGINASFYMAIGELFNQLDEQQINIGSNATQFSTDRFATFLKTKYGKVNTGNSFRKMASKRLKRWRTNLGYTTFTWTDGCSLPYMLDDYEKYCNACGFTLGKLPVLDNMKEFV